MSEENSPRIETFDFEMIPHTRIIFPMEREKGEGSPNSAAIPKVSLRLEEKYMEGGSKTFKELWIILKVESDDARLRAIDIYTQYSGICTLLIKSAPKIWPAGIVFYNLYPNWDTGSDRLLRENEVAIEKIEEPVDYAVAHGLKARSWPVTGSGDPAVVEIGMVKSGKTAGSGYGKPGESFTILVPFGTEKDMTGGGEGSGLIPHNPLCEIEFTYKDKHPIPFAIYNAWGYLSDSFGEEKDYPLGIPRFLDYAIYQPDWLRVGIITDYRFHIKPGVYVYTVKCFTQFEPEMLFETIETQPIIMKYEIGRYVLLSKDEEGGWHIDPSSPRYWEDAVDFLRPFFEEE